MNGLKQCGLVKLTQENISSISGKHIYFVKFFEGYIDEVYTAFPDMSALEGVIEEETSKQGDKTCRGMCFWVKGYEVLKELPEHSVLIITTGYFREEYAQLIDRGVPEAVGDIIYYFANKDTEFYESYLGKFESMLLQNLIVFRSGMGTWEHVDGMDFTENSRALFDYMIGQRLNQRYEMVWLVKDPGRYANVAARHENVRFVSYDWATSDDEEQREDYYRAICLAKFFFFTHACGFCRLPRPGQIRIQLWHGCGFKTEKIAVSHRSRYEYMVVVSRLYAEIDSRLFGLDPAQMLVTGYPKEDWLFHPVADWKERLGIPKAEKYIFWLPTFRSAKGVVSYMNASQTEHETGLPVVGTKEELYVLNEILRGQTVVLVIKVHPLQKREELFDEELSNIVVLENEALSDADLHVNQILGDADALISDYSSAAVDYLMLDRPMAFTLDDLEEYEESRGFVFNPIGDWLPGEKIQTFDEFLGYVNAVLSGENPAQEKRRELRAKMHDYSDDQSSRRLVEMLGM